MSKKLELTSTGTVVVKDADLFDTITTLFDADTVITGFYKFLQIGGAFVLGMMLNSYRYKKSFNPFTPAL